MPIRFSRLFTAGVTAVLFSIPTVRATANVQFPDTLWVPVIFYDYHADGRADFETCEDPNSNVGRKGMVTTSLDVQRKPVPVPSVACPAVGTSFPCACHLAEWFRISGQAGSDNTCIFQCDSLTNPDKPRWTWTGLIPYQSRRGEYTGPNYNADYSMANVIVYDSLCFRLVQGSNGVYEFIDDTFFPLDGHGFGNEPPVGQYNPVAHNFGFTMEMHTKFKYQSGLNFTFRGDDDVWVFINGKLVMDLGGTHYYMDGFLDLDTMAGLVPDQIYSFDLYYAERHSAGSHIQINSNIISASPSEVRISVFPSDTIKAGDTAIVIGTLIDKNGKELPIQSDSIRWTQVPSNAKSGDRLLFPMNDTTMFTGTVAYRLIGIIGTYRSATVAIIDTAWIYIKPGDPAQVDIEQQSIAPLTRDQVAAQVDTFNIRPRQTITLVIGQNTAYAYAVLRDRFANYCSLAEASAWASQNAGVATVTYTAGGAFEGTIGRAAGVRNGSTFVVVSQGTLTPDTAEVIFLADTLLALRLVNIAVPNAAIDTIRMTTDSTLTVKVQGTWATDPSTWIDMTGTWTLNPPLAVTFAIPLPGGEAGQWTLDPSTPGTTILTVQSRYGPSITVPVIVTALPMLDSAITRDVDGNGLIDRIDLTFDRATVIAATQTGIFSVRYGGVVFPITAIVPVDDRHFQLLLQEQASPLLQTSWTPTIALTGIPKVNAASMTCLDGCAPVIYKITKFVKDAGDRAKDTVQVLFSEKIFNPTGGTFYITNQPVMTFITWWGAVGDALADSLLTGIPSFTRVNLDSMLSFSMSNRKNITSDNWMNIRADSRFLRDKFNNYPDVVNRRVRVNVIPVLDINTFPNPSSITQKRIIGDSIYIEKVFPNQKSLVKNWVTTDKAGTVISLNGLQVPPPGPDNSRDPVRLHLKIYDIAGNSVTWTTTNDLFNLVPNQQPPSEINLYWNGINKKGMGVASGVYRAVIYVDYSAASKIKDIRTIKKLGILR